MRKTVFLITFLLSACTLSGQTVQMMQADCQAANPKASFGEDWLCIKQALDQSERHKTPALRHWTAQYRVFGEAIAEIVEADRMDDATAKIELLQFANQLDRDMMAAYAAGVPSSPLATFGKALKETGDAMREVGQQQEQRHFQERLLYELRNPAPIVCQQIGKITYCN